MMSRANRAAGGQKKKPTPVFILTFLLSISFCADTMKQESFLLGRGPSAYGGLWLVEPGGGGNCKLTRGRTIR
jgi:hypothetical protein